MDPVDLTAAGVALIEEATPFFERAAASATRAIARPAFRILSAIRTANRLPGVVIAGDEAARDFWAAHGAIDVADAGKIGFIMKEGVHYARKSFNSARKASQSTMKSWRKRMADFGQWERRVKRRTLKTLGRKYRTKPPSSGPANSAPSGGVLSLATKKFRRPVRPKRIGKSVVLTKDQRGQLTADASQGEYAGWMGFQHHDCLEALSRAAVEGLAQAILAVLKIHPDGQSDQFVIDGVRLGDTPTLTIKWQSVNPNDGQSDTRNQTCSMVSGGNADTFLSLCNFIDGAFLENIRDGFYPISFDVTCTQVGETTMYLHRDVDISNAMLYLSIYQRLDLQNQSKAATTGTAGHEDVASRLNIHSQPLKGKMYVFNNAKADVHDNVHKEHDYLDFFEDTLLDNGVGQYKGLKMKPVGQLVNGKVTHLINHPPAARQLFKNVVKEGTITLGAGDTKKYTTTFKYSGTLRNFCAKVYSHAYFGSGNFYAGVRKPYGAVTWFCFERQLKHGDADMEVAFNRKITTKSYVKLRHQRHQLKRTLDP